MQFNPPLKSASLVKRYKRFLTDVVLPDHSEVTIHCPNTGAMTGCAMPGSTVWMSESDNPKRKYKHTWELAELPSGDWVCVNTHRANQLVEDALREQLPAGLQPFANLRREVKYGEKSRCDLLLERDDRKPNTYIEVKSVTLLSEGQGFFPDAVSQRATRQLKELIELTHSTGEQMAVVYAVLHTGIQDVQPATHIDPKYADMIAQAQAKGLQIYKAFFDINQKGIKFSNWGA